MKSTTWVQYKIDIRERLKTFTLSILALSEKIPATARGKIINYQITKSGTSMYANYRAVLRGRSKAEFFSKLSIAVEEADETEMWLELIMVSYILKTKFVDEIHAESLELVKILSSTRKKLSPP